MALDPGREGAQQNQRCAQVVAYQGKEFFFGAHRNRAILLFGAQLPLLASDILAQDSRFVCLFLNLVGKELAILLFGATQAG